MSIDVIYCILLILAITKGFRNGLIVAAFSFLGILIGLAAAMKLSTFVARWLQDSTHLASAWLPFLSFVLVMIGVMLFIRLGAVFIQSALELAMLGWFNKVAGIVLYAALYTTIFSVFLFYAQKIHWIQTDTFQASHSFAFIQPWGPKAIELFAFVIPLFQGMFEELSHFFDHLPESIK